MNSAWSRADQEWGKDWIPQTGMKVQGYLKIRKGLDCFADAAEIQPGKGRSLWTGMS